MALLLLISGCATAPAPQPAGGDPWDKGKSAPPAPAVVRFADFYFPKQMAGFRRGRPTEYRDKRLGFSVPYYFGNPPLVTSIYVYNRGLAAIPSGPTSTVVRRSFAGSQRAIQVAVERGTYSTARRVYQDIVRLPGEPGEDAPRFLRAVYLIRYAGQSGVRESHLMITGSRNYLWKVRSTFSADPATRKKARLEVLRFLRELMDYQSQI